MKRTTNCTHCGQRCWADVVDDRPLCLDCRARKSDPDAHKQITVFEEIARRRRASEGEQ